MTIPAPTCIEERIWDALGRHSLSNRDRQLIFTAITAEDETARRYAWVLVWMRPLRTGNTLRHAVIRHNPGVMPMTMPSDVQILTALEREGAE